ncbi:hypothetical protein D3C80_1921900 [compost metagenome]
MNFYRHLIKIRLTGGVPFQFVFGLSDQLRQFGNFVLILFEIRRVIIKLIQRPAETGIVE